MSTWRVGVLGLAPCFPQLSHTTDVNIGGLVAAVLDAWCNRVNARIGWPGVSVL